MATSPASSASPDSPASPSTEHAPPTGWGAKFRQVGPGLLAAASALFVVLLVTDLVERFG